LIAGTEYIGFVAVIAAFIPIFSYLDWRTLVSDRQDSTDTVATAVMPLVFGGLSIWLNDPRLFKMKPTFIWFSPSSEHRSVGGQSWLSIS
jgi:intracellular septation protein